MAGEQQGIVVDRRDSEMATFYRNPKLVLEQAGNCAKELKRVMDAKPDPVIFNKQRYLEFEDWSTVGSFYGHTVKISSDKYIDIGGVVGFEATADLLDPNGNVVATAVGMCLRDEDNWGSRPIYEWQYDAEQNKRVRKQVGTRPVPLHQLRSMAQTRAGARVLRLRFSWVVVLAGYSPTVAEEMTGYEEGAQKGGEEAEEKKVRQITDGLCKLIFAKMDALGIGKGMSEEDRKAARRKVAGVILGKEVESIHSLSYDEGMKVRDEVVRQSDELAKSAKKG